MRLASFALLLTFLCAGTGAGFSQTPPASGLHKNDNSLLQKFSEFNLPAAADAAELRLHKAPKDTVALFVRMETAELQERPQVVLDSALRLCQLPAPPELHEIASARILQHAANSLAFNSVLRRVKSAAAIHNGCTFNLRLALVAAAWDGANVDLDTAANSSGLLTHWQIAGPFGRYNNVDFERHWLPETDRFFREQYASEPESSAAKVGHGGPAAPPGDRSHKILPERFWFRDGMISLPEYLSSSGVFYAASEVDLATRTNTRIDVLSSGTYEIFVDGKSVLFHDARYAAAPNRDSSSLSLAAGRHRILVKFTPDAAPLSVALHPQFEVSTQKKAALPEALEQYTQPLAAYFRGDFAEMATLLHADGLNGRGYGKYLQALLYSAAEEHSPTGRCRVEGRSSGATLGFAGAAEIGGERRGTRPT